MTKISFWGTKPFIYFSEQVLTPNFPDQIIARVAKAHGCSVDRDLVSRIYAQAALSVRAQAQLHRPAGPQEFKPEIYRKWLLKVADQVAGTLESESNSGSSGSGGSGFKEALATELAKVQNYKVPTEVREFIDVLESQQILWGVIANAGPLYQAILKYVNLKPFCTVQSRQGFFKPLPAVFQRALERVPRDSKQNTWFVGSADSPCDNVTVDAIKCVLLGSTTDLNPNASRIRIADLSELNRLVLPKMVMDFNDELIEPELAPELVPDLRSTRDANRILPLGAQETNLSGTKTKPSVFKSIFKE